MYSYSSYEVNYNYVQNEENVITFSREVEALIFGVFDYCKKTHAMPLLLLKELDVVEILL